MSKENAILSHEWAKFQTRFPHEWNWVFVSRRHALHEKPIRRARVWILREIINVEIAKSYLGVQVWLDDNFDSIGNLQVWDAFPGSCCSTFSSGLFHSRRAVETAKLSTTILGFSNVWRIDIFYIIVNTLN